MINLLGCLLIGFISTLARDKLIIAPQLQDFLLIGFCGAFTTFSTFIFETSHLFLDKNIFLACLNIAVSVLAGLFCFGVGMIIAKLI